MSQKRATPRRRLPAKEARRRILEAAERRLAEVGPEGLRLTDLAADLGISHPAILHHFGSREGLVAAVVGRAMRSLNQRVLEAMQSGGRGRADVLEMIAEVYAEGGHARLLAWLVLSHRTLEPPDGEEFRPLQAVVELAHARRKRVVGEQADYGDTLFRTQLTALALLGEAVFGDLIRYASGAPTGPDASRDFRRRLAELMDETLRPRG